MAVASLLEKERLDSMMTICLVAIQWPGEIEVMMTKCGSNFIVWHNIKTKSQKLKFNLSFSFRKMMNDVSMKHLALQQEINPSS